MASNQSASPKRERRKRTIIESTQADILLRAYEKNQYPNMHERLQLSAVTGLLERVVHVWFQNRRSMAKRKSQPARQDENSPSAPSEPAVSVTDEYEENPLDLSFGSSKYNIECNGNVEYDAILQESFELSIEEVPSASDSQVLDEAPRLPLGPISQRNNIKWRPFDLPDST